MRELIERQAAIDAAKDWYEGLICGSINGLIKRLNALPTVQPEPHEGEWMPQKGGGLRCSECGGYALDEPDGNFIHIAVPSNFCPNCGAKMKGEPNERFD